MAIFCIVAGIVGIIDANIRAFGHIKGAVHASKELDDSVDRILNIYSERAYPPPKRAGVVL
jgi:hypothetical protein